MAKLKEAAQAFLDLAEDASRCHFKIDAVIHPPKDDEGYSLAYSGYAIKRRDWLDLVQQFKAALEEEVARG